ncbi:hypothetical protein BGZ59_002250 [Podila verticillata]|nr:hypothetical protein BGZ59_002250 [Podila verticillata]
MEKALVKALKTNATRTTLSLYSNSTGPNGAQALAEALVINATLTTLSLYGNSIESSGAQALVEALKTNSTLTTLELLNKVIAFECTLALILARKINTSLITLHGSDLIKGNTVGARSEAFKTNSTLTTLNLNRHSITYNGSRLLSAALKTNSVLTILNLDHNSIGDNGAEIGNNGVQALKANRTLTTLELWSCKIGYNEAQVLAEALMINATLVTPTARSDSVVIESLLGSLEVGLEKANCSLHCHKLTLSSLAHFDIFQL